MNLQLKAAGFFKYAQPPLPPGIKALKPKKVCQIPDVLCLSRALLFIEM